jgi:hypothetical protein
MNKLLVQHINHKFINNISLSQIENFEKLITITSNQLYKIYYEYKFTHAIFIDSLLTNEEIQFIHEFGNDINIYIFKNNETSNYSIIKNIKGILSFKPSDTSHKFIKIPTLVNHGIYYKTNDIKDNNIICFLDNIDLLPDSLNSYLYPHSKLAIKLFNNSDVVHPQNLGLLSENDKAYILQKNKYYLALNEDYVAEAWACGCEVLSTKDLDSLKPSIYKHSKAFQSYSNFLKGLLNAKK